MIASTKSADVYTAIADGTRRALLLRLAQEGERSVSDLWEPLPISQPAVSKHLRILRQVGLVRSRQDGRTRLYSIDARKLREVFDWVSHFDRYWEEKLDSLGAHLDARQTEKKD